MTGMWGKHNKADSGQSKQFEQFSVRRRGGSDGNKEPTGNPSTRSSSFSVKTLDFGNVLETDKCLKVLDFPNEITVEQICVQNADLLTVAATGKIAIIQLF